MRKIRGRALFCEISIEIRRVLCYNAGVFLSELIGRGTAEFGTHIFPKTAIFASKHTPNEKTALKRSDDRRGLRYWAAGWPAGRRTDAACELTVTSHSWLKNGKSGREIPAPIGAMKKYFMQSLLDEGVEPLLMAAPRRLPRGGFAAERYRANHPA